MASAGSSSQESVKQGRPERGLRVFAGALDQVFSSTSNGLITFAIAVESSVGSFGQVALMLLALFTVMGAQRGALGTPLLLKSDQPGERIDHEGSFALSAALVAGVALSGVLLALGATLGLAGVLLAISAPIVLLQDVLRYVSIARGRAEIAAIWDGIWFVGTAVLLVCAWTKASFVSVPFLISGWACLAIVALAGMSVSLRVAPRVRGLAAWIRSGWQHRVRYCIDAGLEQATVFLALAIVAAVLSSLEISALRGATVLLAPIAILGSAFQLIIISESTRQLARPRAVWFTVVRLMLSVVVLTSIIGIALTFLPASAGTYLLGESFEPAREVLPVVVVEYCAATLTFGLGIFLKTFNRSSDALRFKVFSMVVTVLCSTAAVFVFHSAIGVAVGLAVGTLLGGSMGVAWFAPWESRERAKSVDVAADYFSG